MNSQKLPACRLKTIFIILVFTLILSAGLISCSNNVTNPVINTFGIKGHVFDSSGNPLDSVQIYCLYNYYNAPVSPYDKISLKKNSVIDTTFKLYQNIPNPFSKSTYIRFNLPWAAQIELTVTDKLSGAVKYDYRDSRQAGYYQIYLNNLVTEKQLRNGIYKYKLTAKNSSGKTFSAENEMLVISDSSEANWITNSNGNYFFGFDETFDGDTVITTSDGGYYYPTVLTNTVNLEIKRRGYASQLINVTLYPDINLQRDIVLDKEVQQ